MARTHDFSSFLKRCGVPFDPSLRHLLRGPGEAAQLQGFGEAHEGCGVGHANSARAASSSPAHAAAHGCLHDVVRPPGWIPDPNGPVYDEKNPAKVYPFRLDTFQQKSVEVMEQGESVMVAAHTSAGKTVVAEYAIAMALLEASKPPTIRCPRWPHRMEMRVDHPRRRKQHISRHRDACLPLPAEPFIQSTLHVGEPGLALDLLHMLQGLPVCVCVCVGRWGDLCQYICVCMYVCVCVFVCA